MKTKNILIVFFFLINSVDSLVFQNVIDYLSSNKDNVVNCESTNEQIYFCQMSLSGLILKIDIKQITGSNFTLKMYVDKLPNNNFNLPILSQTFSHGLPIPEFNEKISIVPINLNYNLVMLPLYYRKILNDEIGIFLYIQNINNDNLLKYEDANKPSGEIVFCTSYFTTTFNLDRDENYDMLNPYITSLNKSVLKREFDKYFDISICSQSEEGCNIKTYYFLGKIIINNELEYLISILKISSFYNNEHNPILINFHGHNYLWDFHQVFIFLDTESNEIYVIDPFFGHDAFILLRDWLKLINVNFLKPFMQEGSLSLKKPRIDKTMKFKIMNTCKHDHQIADKMLISNKFQFLPINNEKLKI